jgi:hypothetical protein
MFLFKTGDKAVCHLLIISFHKKGDNMTKLQRSMQIWSLLICAARERKTYTYGLIADALSMGGAGVMAQFLDPIMRFCADKNYPPLTVLVVNQDTGLPGEGLVTIQNVNVDRESVFNFDWFSIEPPQVSDFENSVSQ